MLVRFAACGQVSFGNRVLRAEAAPHRRIGAAAGVSRPLALRAWRDLLFSRAQARRKHPFGACLQTRKTPRIHCKNRSKSKAQKTPPSHGLTGLAAIETVARKAALVRFGVRGSRAGLERYSPAPNPIEPCGGGYKTCA